MVSLTVRQDLADIIAEDPGLERFQMLLNGEELRSSAASAGDIRDRLLSEIAGGSKEGFKHVASEVGERRISAESDWCNDDYLLFLLLLGKEKFQIEMPFVSEVIEVRRFNSNTLPYEINRVFGELNRGNFSINEGFDFLKIPFLKLVGKLRIDVSGAKTALIGLSQQGLLASISPFLKLLALKAHDLILFERQSLALETGEQLVSAFQEHASKLSVRQWLAVIRALPGYLLIGGLMALLGCGLLPFCFGLGKGAWDTYSKEPPRERPAVVNVAELSASEDELPQEIKILRDNLEFSGADSELQTFFTTVKLVNFTESTPPFTIEISHPNRKIDYAVSFVKFAHSTDGSYIFVQAQRDAGRVRVLLPQMEQEKQLFFVLGFRVNKNENTDALVKSLVFRSLE